MVMKKHFVVFYSPGTLVSETTEKPIASWDVEKAKKMARAIKERHGATPYGFRFSTRERKATELDSKETKYSGMYYLGGRILTLEDVKREMPKEETLIWNMTNNHIKKIIINDNSWRTMQAFGKGDKLVEWKK
jgi:hypothetical protein